MDNYKKVLVLAVGGGNDSVSTLLLQLQLQKTFGYNPDTIDIVAVLPDCLSYGNMKSTSDHLISIINPDSYRCVGDKLIQAFPEKVLSENKSYFSSLNIRHIFGISMIEGSIGISHSLKFLVDKENYDLVLSIDVGGDFIAHRDNIEVLSPMMDGYMLYSLKELNQYILAKQLKTEMLFSIFGLGTDGESTPDMLKKGMSLIPDIQEFDFKKADILPFVDFYRNIVEKNRYSRTTDYTLLEICGENHPNPSLFRGRFHTKTDILSKSNVYYGNFNHYQDESFFGKYYLFKDISNIENIYSKPANSGIEWFLNVQKQSTKINHELNGQSYSDIGLIFNNKNLEKCSLYFGTPSRKFNHELQQKIVLDIIKSVENSVYDLAFIYKDYANLCSNTLVKCEINNDIILIAKNHDIFKEFQKEINNMVNR